MRKVYYKDGVEVRKPKEVVLNGLTVYSPSDSQIERAGYEIREIIDPIPEPYIPTYAELVEQYIREHGYPTYGAELAVVNNYSENPSEYLESWQHYQGVRHEAKEWAETQQHREEESV